MSNYNKVDFGAMQSEMTGIFQQHTQFEQDMQQLIQKVSQYKDTWTGAARNQWDVVEADWNKQMEIMRNKLFQAGEYLKFSHERMVDDERTNTGLFAM